ncbi:MAG TPA: hypothetical protein VE780_08110 [Thermoleophilaceae bacterium]|nr:hypothetical protein [Thermoleophilaceae bacterium]
MTRSVALVRPGPEWRSAVLERYTDGLRRTSSPGGRPAAAP